MRIVTTLLLFLLLPTSSYAKKTIKPSATKEVVTIKKESPARSITLVNAIKPTMLTVHKFGTHNPDSFSLLVNGKKLEPGTQATVTADGNRITVGYEYAFAGGLYKGKKDVELAVDPQNTQVELTFSWKDKHRIQADHATATSIKNAS